MGTGSRKIPWNPAQHLPCFTPKPTQAQGDFSDFSYSCRDDGKTKFRMHVFAVSGVLPSLSSALCIQHIFQSVIRGLRCFYCESREIGSIILLYLDHYLKAPPPGFTNI